MSLIEPWSLVPNSLSSASGASESLQNGYLHTEHDQYVSRCGNTSICSFPIHNRTIHLHQNRLLHLRFAGYPRFTLLLRHVQQDLPLHCPIRTRILLARCHRRSASLKPWVSLRYLIPSGATTCQVSPLRKQPLYRGGQCPAISSRHCAIYPVRILLTLCFQRSRPQTSS